MKSKKRKSKAENTAIVSTNTSLPFELWLIILKNCSSANDLFKAERLNRAFRSLISQNPDIWKLFRIRYHPELSSPPEWLSEKQYLALNCSKICRHCKEKNGDIKYQFRTRLCDPCFQTVARNAGYFLDCGFENEDLLDFIAKGAKAEWTQSIMEREATLIRESADTKTLVSENQRLHMIIYQERWNSRKNQVLSAMAADKNLKKLPYQTYIDRCPSFKGLKDAAWVDLSKSTWYTLRRKIHAELKMAEDTYKQERETAVRRVLLAVFQRWALQEDAEVSHPEAMSIDMPTVDEAIFSHRIQEVLDEDTGTSDTEPAIKFPAAILELALDETCRKNVEIRLAVIKELPMTDEASLSDILIEVKCCDHINSAKLMSYQDFRLHIHQRHFDSDVADLMLKKIHISPPKHMQYHPVGLVSHALKEMGLEYTEAQEIERQHGVFLKHVSSPRKVRTVDCVKILQLKSLCDRMNSIHQPHWKHLHQAGNRRFGCALCLNNGSDHGAQENVGSKRISFAQLAEHFGEAHSLMNVNDVIVFRN
ncbi:hypothetical protein SeLEV6574_g04720 [Synchytrium endobioticum]|uniref:F-box domain-containing protein n=1 Tax=Synchytrium endobioticum TaxID=286115 RepID=A0A507CYD9_9FUNG|nr:hypothetical protein SeLEV6574_g04705 [Synchytrium endobioticum]TPX44101.1 hypothetical protein SeLEV6574_g04720 [Synchytrium endobioticum]